MSPQDIYGHVVSEEQHLRGVVYGRKPRTLVDPWVSLTFEGLESQHEQWERSRRALPRKYDEAAEDWRAALVASPIGNPPTVIIDAAGVQIVAHS